ncbi:MAG: hypothetical protein RQ760_14400, partial [Sedimentisphaerales bacterium]|nr:hypothetical protein [Sedimentisphaerales bacterium]
HIVCYLSVSAHEYDFILKEAMNIFSHIKDHIAILDKGVIIKASRTEQLRESVRKFVLTPKQEVNFSGLAGILDILKVGDNVSITVEDCDDEKRNRLKSISVNGMTEVALNLDEIFEAYVIGNRGRELSV